MSEHLDDARKALQDAQVICDEATVNAAYDRMANEVTALVGDKDPVIVCAMMGGLVTTAEIVRRLSFPFELDYLHATRYRGDTEGGELLWKASPSIVLEDRNILIIDDILDEGHTLNAIVECLGQQRPSTIHTAVLVEKQHDRRDPELHADVTGLHLDDHYLFGCGMDYRGYHRQLREIVALSV